MFTQNPISPAEMSGEKIFRSAERIVSPLCFEMISEFENALSPLVEEGHCHGQSSGVLQASMPTGSTPLCLLHQYSSTERRPILPKDYTSLVPTAYELSDLLAAEVHEHRLMPNQCSTIQQHLNPIQLHHEAIHSFEEHQNLVQIGAETGSEDIPSASELSDMFVAEIEEEDRQCCVSLVTDSSSEAVPEKVNQEHSFPWKLYDLIEDAERNGFSDIISWEFSGRAFKVHNHAEFFAKVMPLYFHQTKYESFRRQLNLYGFLRVSRGRHRGTYMHHCFIKGQRDFCQFIARRISKNQL